ncbi:MAG: MASE1 domain-containing protein [Thermoleophilia bacterium]|nr:MASE1 domain-containing protein [Thermoleophilia bacterium]
MTFSPNRLQLVAWSIAVGVVYATFAVIALEAPLGSTMVAPFWAPAGVAVAGLTLLGPRAWPAVYAAAVVAGVIGGASLATALGVAVGASVEAVLAAYLLRRLDLHASFDRIRDVITIALVSLIACAPSALGGVTLLAAAGIDSDESFASLAALWWFGDVMGIIVVAPVLLTATALVAGNRRLQPARTIEFTLVIGTLAAASWLVFSDEHWRRPVMLLPMWCWATIRFRAFGASVATLVIATFGVISAANGGVSFPGASASQSIQMLNALFVVGGLSLLAIAASVTERDAARARVEQALAAEQDVARELRRLDELKDRLLAAVSHELRTPLTSILALATLLHDGERTITASKRHEMLEHVMRESKRLDALLTDLLDVERVRMGMLDPTLGDVDLAQLVRTVVERHTCEQRPTQIDLEPVRVQVDAMMVDRIVDNLVRNARRHTPPDRRVFVRVRAHEDGALIVVDDEGDGVPDTDKTAIFEPFHRGSTSVTDAPGTGIGLSLVLQFAQLHGGRAWVEDRPGGGASFRVYLPG